jgi:hypothetical protein
LPVCWDYPTPAVVIVGIGTVCIYIVLLATRLACARSLVGLSDMGCPGTKKWSQRLGPLNVLSLPGRHKYVSTFTTYPFSYSPNPQAPTAENVPVWLCTYIQYVQSSHFSFETMTLTQDDPISHFVDSLTFFRSSFGYVFVVESNLDHSISFYYATDYRVGTPISEPPLRLLFTSFIDQPPVLSRAPKFVPRRSTVLVKAHHTV